MNLDDLSRGLSHALRHEPWLYELELDDDGWASLRAVVEALRGVRPEWSTLSISDIERMISNAQKQRHELSGDRIRALYGHSFPGKLKKELGDPPGKLFHGTTGAAAEAILHEGLRPMSRQYVHLSTDEETAEQVGRRKSARPVILTIDAAAALKSQVIFYLGNEKVWLADFVPASFISRQRIVE
jgi:putative RNA 2'-phosphotransferase